MKILSYYSTVMFEIDKTQYSAYNYIDKDKKKDI